MKIKNNIQVTHEWVNDLTEKERYCDIIAYNLSTDGWLVVRHSVFKPSSALHCLISYCVEDVLLEWKSREVGEIHVIPDPLLLADSNLNLSFSLPHWTPPTFIYYSSFLSFSYKTWISVDQSSEVILQGRVLPFWTPRTIHENTEMRVEFHPLQVTGATALPRFTWVKQVVRV